MKYIKLFEAFESEVITNTIKFLTKKLGQNSADDFLYSFKKLIKEYNVPISKIKEDDLEYYRAAKAIKIKNKVPVDNKFDIYCIKYWFSLEKGLLGKTATGNLTTPYIKIKNDYYYKNENFDDDQIENINSELGIKKGKLTSVLDYKDLKTGDDVFVILGDNKNSEKVTIGKIFIDNETNSIFIYNNDKSDGTSTYDKPDFYQDYKYTWRLFRFNNDGPDDDHFKLHLYTKDNRKLRQETKIEKNKHKANLGDFNKPLDTEGNICDWSIKNQGIIENVIEKSDFAIVIYMDKLLSKPTITSIHRNREAARKGATALMSDYDIKQLNIVNYTNKLVTKYGLNKDIEDFSKLNKLVNSIMCHKFIMFNLYLDKNMYSLNSIIDQLYYLVNGVDKEFDFNNVLRTFKNNRERTINVTEVYRINLGIILNSGNENLITIIERFIHLGGKINKYIENIDVENIHDLIMIRYKLKAIEGFISDYKNKLATPYNDVINSFDSRSESMRRYVSYCEDLDEEDFIESMIKLDIIEKFVNSILK